jgi:hypothetical protein
MDHTVPVSPPPSQALEQQFALRVRARLDAAEGELGHDIEQRLRFARERALGAARVLAAREATGVVLATGSVAVGTTPWRWRIASLLPFVVLAAGLLLIGQLHRQQDIHAAAEVDAVLLADELPPTAYSDPGFAEFLKRTLP